MKIFLCSEKESEQILNILNDAILNTTAIYDYKPRAIESMGHWFEAKKRGQFPVVGAFDEANKLLGFGTYGSFRNWAAYKYSVEHSVYVKAAERRKGLGRLILEELIRLAEVQNIHTMVAGIDSENKVSISLHEKLGFQYSGTIKQAGYKFGKWLDLVFLQKLLVTPLYPTED